ncbi:hypothetical protein BU23DRAFT_143066 [Bimuria novae-zelandiae CBS 107.79]|uniref:Capsule polysaccharide biosynthesis protein n=1 Tax=Bimuria novae-zelandiae CBS 107.79 TaxID=1447943 RepID=A0A6A5V8W3_9PLEO|nr:hypothetical protein BU23DRAFT_143066 [Bimuria novae-zelandiae CBS 107.79]
MAGPRIPIPPEFASQLRHVPSKDPRTDAEIIAALSQHAPITSEKNIWTYWHTGIDAMPTWNKRTICDWVRIHGPDWTVRILNTVPGHPNHALNWIESDQLPKSFVEGTMTGPYTGPHSADFLRGAALYRYGGVWLDVGCILFRSLDMICWDQLADETSPFTISAPIQWETTIANAFVAARKADIFIKKWHELFVYLWKGRGDWRGVVESKLIEPIIRSFEISRPAAAGINWQWTVDPMQLLGYVGQVLAWHRVAWLKEPDGGFDGVEYYTKHALCFDALNEIWAAEKTLGFDGAEVFKVFTTRRDTDPESEDYKKAYKTAWRLLTRSSMQKITHGKGLTEDLHVGYLLDRNEGSDCAPGTFGELLRYGSVHFEQVRERVEYWDAYRIDEKRVIHKGLLEA